MSTVLDTSLALRHAYSMFPSGVAAVCALGPDDEPVGMAMSSFTTVSLEPPLVSVCVDRSSTTWPKLAALPTLGVSVLGAGHAAAAAALASKTGDRFRDVPWHATSRGAVLVDGSALWLECRVYDQFDAGDHELILLEALDLVPHPDTPPLVFHQSALRPLGT
jgi:flavin reductase (DIM6/NTAB) family NADH-FMN oxidoreductase RutF